MKPYYEVGGVVVYLGDMREILSKLEVSGGFVLRTRRMGRRRLGGTDGWMAGRLCWTGGFVVVVFWVDADVLARGGEFLDGGWRMSQDLVWEKNTTGWFHADRFKRVHEHAVHWFRGEWGRCTSRR